MFETDEEGFFEVCGLQPQTLFISAAKHIAREQWFTSRRILLEEGQAYRVVLQLEPPERDLRPGGVLHIAVRLPDGKPADLTAPSSY